MRKQYTESTIATTISNIKMTRFLSIWILYLHEKTIHQEYDITFDGTTTRSLGCGTAAGLPDWSVLVSCMFTELDIVCD